MTQNKPVILHTAGCEEGWDDELHGRVQWRTLFSAERTSTEALTAGVAEIRPGNRLKVHRHAPAELYYLLAGEGMVTIDGTEYPVGVGTAVFIPGNAAHGIRNTGQTLLRFFYAFAVNSFDEVEYIFPG
ncbi:MAG: cupin domain-containing protein [Anaerolineae bacterium]|nr:cupin domain-containing protein [Anaerolineae bacterium]